MCWPLQEEIECFYPVKKADAISLQNAVISLDCSEGVKQELEAVCVTLSYS